MSKNYLMLNGKRIDLTEEQVKTLTGKEKKSPFERVNNKEYFFICPCGEVLNTTDYHTDGDNKNYEVANYCTEKTLVEQRALHEILNRLLWRYSEEHSGDCGWDGYKSHWHILRSESSKTFETESNADRKRQGIIYFKDEKTAQSAIKEIVKPFMAEHPEFVW